MKKLRLLFLFLSSILWTSVSGAVYPNVHNVRQVTPAVSALRLEQQGLIMQVIVQNLAHTNFYVDVLTFYNFDRQNPVVSLAGISYENLLTKFETIRSSDLALRAARAIEHAIMYLYDQKVYAYGSYQPGQSIFFTGIRKDWGKPWTYFSWDNWTSDNDVKLERLITELNSLANRIEQHSYSEYMRLKMTVESYRNWRRNFLIALAIYLAADAKHHGMKNSTLNQLYQGGLCNIDGIAMNAVSNAASATWMFTKLTAKGAYKTLKFAINPISKCLLFGFGSSR